MSRVILRKEIMVCIICYTNSILLLLIAAYGTISNVAISQMVFSSLNSPTPVSAVMHAGLVNGGGFLLGRFAHLYLQHSNIMMIIFIIGMISVLLGTLMQK